MEQTSACFACDLRGKDREFEYGRGRNPDLSVTPCSWHIPAPFAPSSSSCSPGPLSLPYFLPPSLLTFVFAKRLARDCVVCTTEREQIPSANWPDPKQTETEREGRKKERKEGMENVRSNVALLANMKGKRELGVYAEKNRT